MGLLKDIFLTAGAIATGLLILWLLAYAVQILRGLIGGYPR